MTSEVFNIDCMIGMAAYPDKYFDLAVVDPPYGIGVSEMNIGAREIKNKSCDNKQWDNAIPNKSYFDELKRISKNQIIWGANYFNCFNGNMGAIVWHKNNPLPTSSDCEIASYSKHSKVAIYNKTWTNYVNDKETNHPTEKPIALYDWIYKNYLPQGGKVIDTHLGSGSNRIAADRTGNIDFTGYEIDKDYFEAQEKRYRQYKSQLVLF